MNKKLRCLLLDDELPGLTYLKMLCEQLPELEVVKAFKDPETFLLEAPNLDFDICILDIGMPRINGLQIAASLNRKPVIFTTAYKDYAADAFDLDAIDYLRKPVTLQRLKEAVSKAIRRLDVKSPSRSFVQLNTDKGKVLVFFDQLCYIKNSDIDGRDKIAILEDGSSLTLKNIAFERLEELLPHEEFSRINRKEIISLRIVRASSIDEIITTLNDSGGNALKLTLSDVFRNEFTRKLKR